MLKLARTQVQMDWPHTYTQQVSRMQVGKACMGLQKRDTPTLGNKPTVSSHMSIITDFKRAHLIVFGMLW